MGDVLTDTPAHIHKIAIEPSVRHVNVAVTQDAKDAHTADFTVNLKDPLSCKEAPAAGSALGLQPATELDGTYDTYTHTAAAGTTAASAQIVLTDGFLQPEKKAGAGAPHRAKAFTRAPRAVTRLASPVSAPAIAGRATQMLLG